MTIKGQFDFVLHCCNCQNVMGKGIAKTLRDIWPEVHKADLATKKGDREKLGSWSWAKVRVVNDHPVVIINGYMQCGYGTGHQLDYEAMALVLKKINIKFKGSKIAMPLLGCHNAGSNPTIVVGMIIDLLPDLDVSIVDFKIPAYIQKKFKHISSK